MKGVLIFFPMWIKILCVIENGINSHRIVQTKFGSYAHITRVVNKLEEMQFITAKKEGRQRTIYLTEYGRQYQIVLKQLMQHVDIFKQHQSNTSDK